MDYYTFDHHMLEENRCDLLVINYNIANKKCMFLNMPSYLSYFLPYKYFLKLQPPHFLMIRPTTDYTKIYVTDSKS